MDSASIHRRTCLFMLPIRLLGLALCFLLASCFEVREEIWIDSRGHGKMTVDYSLPQSVVTPLGGEAGIRKQVEDLLVDAPDLKLDDLQVSQSDGQAHIHVSLSTESMLSLLDLQDSPALAELPPAATRFIGDFEVKRDGLSIDFSRKVDAGKALGFAAMLISQEDRTDRRTTYIIHLPVAAPTHNATRVENDGRTLIWDQSLGDALKNPTDMTFTAPIPLPWGWIITGLVVLIALPTLLIRRWRARRVASTDF